MPLEKCQQNIDQVRLLNEIYDLFKKAAIQCIYTHVNVLDNNTTRPQPSKLRTKNWVQIVNDARGEYNS